MSVENTPKLTNEIIAHPAIKKIAVSIFGVSLFLMIPHASHLQVHRI